MTLSKLLVNAILCAILFLIKPVLGQSERENDSIIIEQLISKGDLAKDTLLKQKYYKEALTYSLEIGSEKDISTAAQSIAGFKRKIGQPDSAKYFYQRALKDIESSTERTKIYLGIISVLRQEDKRDSALYYLEKSTSNSKFIKDVSLLSRIYVGTGNFWFYEQNFKQAFKYYSKSDSVLSRDPEFKVSTRRAQTLNYLGYAVRVASGYQKALQYYLSARKIYDNLEKDKVYHEINVALAQAYINLEQYDKAMGLLDESIDYNKTKGFLNAYSYNLIVRGYGYVKMKEFEKAKQDYFEYYDVVQQMKSAVLVARAKEYLGYFFYESGSLEESERYYKEALSYYEKTNKKKLQLDVLESLIKVNKKGKRYDNLIQLYDTLLTRKRRYEQENIEIQTRELESKYQAEKKEQQIQLLQAQNEAVEAQKTNQRNVLLGGIGITTFAGIFMFLLYRNRQKTNKKLRELDTAKSNFFANISHELRTPLALIATPIQEKLKRNDLPEKERREYELILRNNGRLTNLVDQLLDLSKLESGNLSLKVMETNAQNFFEAQLEPYRYFAKSQELDFQISMNLKEEGIWLDREAIQKILSNLFSNAIKHSAANGRVNGHFRVTSQGLTIEVKNTAAPFTKLQKEQLFNRFYQTDQFKEGAGIGLALVKELVQLHKGKIEVNDGDGFVTFKVVLPCQKSDFAPEELYDGATNVQIAQEPILPSGQAVVPAEDSLETDSGLPLLLIVEDNADLRSVLQETFKSDYRIAVAVNGEEGSQRAIEHVPDLIISDVMMPKKNGVELTKELKAHELTSHIPIILLTAKAGDKNELTGIDSGADDYITKPFNNTLLKSKMTNLLRNRQKMRDRYSQEVILKPQDIAVTPSDELLLERIQSVLDTYLMESSFSTEDFAKEMGFSRMQLHRKLKALTGLSATEFMRSQRLKLAAQLLEKSDANVSEVCYQSGFNNLSYFAKCFKDAYGVSPSQYPKKG